MKTFLFISDTDLQTENPLQTALMRKFPDTYFVILTHNNRIKIGENVYSFRQKDADKIEIHKTRTEQHPFVIKLTKLSAISRIIFPVNTKFGAPMGRASVGERPAKGKIYDRKVPISLDGAYDAGGAYWGYGAELRVKYTKDLSYIEFYRLGDKI